MKTGNLDAIEEEAEEEEKDITNESVSPKVNQHNAHLISELVDLARELPKHLFLPHKYDGNLLQTYFKHTHEDIERQIKAKVSSRLNE